MSITLTAFPTAFLVSPKLNKEIKLSQIISKVKNEGLKSLLHSNFDTLQSVSVLTNLTMTEIPRYMRIFDGCINNREYSYKLKNGLTVDWVTKDGYCCAILSGDLAYKTILKYSEDFFEVFEKVKGYNIRDINSEELFYYTYLTEYTTSSQILDELKKLGAKNIVVENKNCVKALYNNQNIKYYADNITGKFLLEMEQKISLVNIGLGGNLLSDFKINTNIKQNELENLLSALGYDFNKEKCITHLKDSNSIIYWELDNGIFNANLKDVNVKDIQNEIETIFIQMNKISGRDLRLIENKTEYTYTYKTNYTDKEVLINTLTEHGALNIIENDGNITCELFGMKMTYKKPDNLSSYDLVIDHVKDESECKNLLSDLNDEYGLNIQEITYKKILERIRSENMHLESEEVLEDDSIVLTIEI